jgi:Undecaprenyl-phosphate galactose phosphotransferase WbaP
MRKTQHKLPVVKLLCITADLLTIASIATLMTLLRKELGGEFHIASYTRLWPFLIFFWLAFEKMGLYSGTSIFSGACLGPAEEIRRIFYGLTAVFILLGFGNYCYHPDDYLYSRGVLLGSFLLCIIAVPIERTILRKIFTRMGCWGIPVILIGSGKMARTIFDSIHRHPEYGLRPVGYFTDQQNSTLAKDAVFLGALNEIVEKTKALSIQYAILAKDDGMDPSYIQKVIRQYGPAFPHLLLIPESLSQIGTGISPKDIGGTLGLEIRHNLQIPSIYRIKRIIDYLLAFPTLIATLPLLGLLAAWVKLDSSGPVFFKHQRVTKNGRQINIYKFRTMDDGAQEELNELLRSSPELQEEWTKYGKLENDPRITRAGKWLRRSSLDELPQLFNVLQGKLTLVGPRPLVEKELEIYGEAASLFDQVLPGLTGLWQVSGRNELTYTERAKLDLYYVNNWSVWLDIYILAKTVYAVFFRHGAK